MTRRKTSHQELKAREGVDSWKSADVTISPQEEMRGPGRVSQPFCGIPSCLWLFGGNVSLGTSREVHVKTVWGEDPEGLTLGLNEFL